MNGVAYQQDSAAGGASTASNKYADPLVDVEGCKRDIPLLKALRTNTIRTYAIDPKGDHDECMKLLDEAGIYVISDLSEPGLSINRKDPRWDVELLKRYTGVVDNLSKYTNVIGFFAGNEVSNDKTNTPASAYVKAAVRDTKAHIKKNVNRWMGVGYAANDDPHIRVQIAHYFNCGPEEDAIDYWGYNIYSWCGKSSMTDSGYDKQVDFFSNYSVPVFFAEYGCNLPNGADGRIWEETKALYSKEMTEVISGGIVYMYHQEENDYGLVKIKDKKATTMKDYDTLQKVMAAVDPAGTDMDTYKPTNSPQACPAVDASWKVKGSTLPPSPDPSLCDCMYQSLSCVPSDELSEKDFGDMFGFVCGESPKACVGIEGNTATGVYGAYSMCGSRQQLGYVLDQYYQSQDSAKTACDFKGKATIQSKSEDSTCDAAISSASAANAFAATATSAAGGGEETSNAAVGGGPGRGLFGLGELVVAGYVVAAMGVGAGIVLF
jgi:hypothetical protein